jgi:hypothetical protein
MDGINRCWVCGSTSNLEFHHIFGGCRRQTSEKYGIKVYLCQKHHSDVTDCKDTGLVEELHRWGQIKFQRENPNLSFLKVFGKNYL